MAGFVRKRKKLPQCVSNRCQDSLKRKKYFGVRGTLSNKMLVEINLFQVRPTYGRKMMSGYIRSKGLTLSGKQVSKSLRQVNPVSHARRTEDTVRTMETSYTSIKTKN